MRRLEVTAALVGGMLVAAQATASAQQPGTLTQEPGTIVEMVLKPCTPDMPRDQCGVTLKLVKGSATFTSTDGQTYSLTAANSVLSVNGNGVATQSTQNGTILNFAATGNTTTTASAGGGGGAGTTGSLGGTGGGGGGGGGGGNNVAANTGGVGTLTGGGGGGGGGGSSSGGTTLPITTPASSARP
jgi:hypothetical protein